MAIKDDYIKIRVSKEQKELFKDIAKKKNISMSKFIIVSTEERALREKEKFEGTKSLELRVSELEKKLQEIKLKMESQKAEKKSFLKFLKSEYNDEEIEIKASYPVALHEETKNNLMKAADGENAEWTKDYPQFAQIAKKEGFNKIAIAYEKIAKIEARHERRYRRLLNNMENDTLFKKDETVFWKCNNCGYIYEGKEAPKVCPACLHLQGYFELFIENY